VGAIPRLSVRTAGAEVTGELRFSGALAADGAGASNLDASKFASGTLDVARLPTSGVTAGTYGSSTRIPVLTFDDRGRVTTAATAVPSLVQHRALVVQDLNLRVDSMTVNSGLTVDATYIPVTQTQNGVTYDATVKITPTSSTSKILVRYNGQGYAVNTTVNLWIYRNGAKVGKPVRIGGPILGHYLPMEIAFLDSPGSTAEQTYKLYFCAGGNATGTGGVHAISYHEYTDASFTAEEISA